MRKLSLTLTGLCLVAAPAFAEDPAEALNAALERFQQDPGAFINQRLQKEVVQGAEGSGPVFAEDAIRTGDFITDRDRWRVDEQNPCMTKGGAQICLRDIREGRAPFESNDLVEDLVDSEGDAILRTLEAMESRRLRSAELEESPWSDDYWPIYAGQTSMRYADSSFPRSPDFLRNMEAVFSGVGKSRDGRITSMGDVRRSSSMDNLSPAEKYDLLVGDANMTLTKAMWADGQEYYNRGKHDDEGNPVRDGEGRMVREVETWMGLCHGWAPGAFMVPRPTRAITMKAKDAEGHEFNVKFYPSDIKALATLLWAKARAETKFIGGRCNTKDPKAEDVDEYGRVISQECFDTNPGTWHMVVVNQIGVSRRSFVLDATFDYEVWNQPVHAYSYTYFNPQTKRAASGLEQAKVEKAAFSADAFSSIRDRKYDEVNRERRARGLRPVQYTSVVGVAMDVTYVVETQPTHAETDHMSRDGLRRVRYMYDLELDRDGKIVGGEWYTQLHPDFLWVPPVGAKALSVGDQALAQIASRRPEMRDQLNWDGSGTVPELWSMVAHGRGRQSASAYGQPLSKVVDVLVTLSRAGMNGDRRSE